MDRTLTHLLHSEDIIIVYNDLYVETAGNKHPALLGQLCREGWAEIWGGLKSIAERALAGETCFFRDHFLAMERMGFTEETCASDPSLIALVERALTASSLSRADHTFSYAPFYDHEGNVLGIYNLSIECVPLSLAPRRPALTPSRSSRSTATVVAARRLATVRDLVQMTSLARTVEGASPPTLLR